VFHCHALPYFAGPLRLCLDLEPYCKAGPKGKRFRVIHSICARARGVKDSAAAVSSLSRTIAVTLLLMAASSALAADTEPAAVVSKLYRGLGRDRRGRRTTRRRNDAPRSLSPDAVGADVADHERALHGRIRPREDSSDTRLAMSRPGVCFCQQNRRRSIRPVRTVGR